ncbi:MAG: VanW family protein [Thermoleophilia bacterium]|nr:VanW family protein [Thermoleophilia bacterium]
MRIPKTTKRSRRQIWRRRALFVVGCLIVAFLLVVLIDSAVYNNKVHAGVTIAGRSVSGLTRDEAAIRIRQAIRESWGTEVTLKNGSKTWTVTPGDVELEADVESAVSTALDITRKGNFLVDLGRRLKLLFIDEDVALQGAYDGNLMARVLYGVAQQVDLAPVEAGIAIDGDEVRFVEGRKGLLVDRATLREQLKAALLTFQPVEVAVPMKVKEPALVVEDHRQAVKDAESMVSAPVVLRSGNSKWELTPEQIAAYMGFVSEDRGGVPTLAVFLSADKMSPFLREVATKVDVEPVDARFKTSGAKVWVELGKMGKALDFEATAQALTAAALTTEDRAAKAVMVEVEPDLMAKEAEAMGVRTRLSTFTTKYEGTAERQTNVRITTEFTSYVILAPGEEYDFIKQIGPRTAERGYQLAPGIAYREMEDVLGGGICQVSTTLFNAAFFAGLKIVERKNHSIYIDHYPKGRDATATSNGPNMRFLNDTGHHILIRGASDGITTTFDIYGTNDGRQVGYSTGEFYDKVPRAVWEIKASWLEPGVKSVRVSGQEGRSIDVVRTVTAKDGTVIHKDKFTSTWKMITREIEVGVGSTTTTTLPDATTGSEPGATPGTTTGTTSP